MRLFVLFPLALAFLLPITTPLRATEATETRDTGTNELHVSFRAAPLELVLNHLAEAAGCTLEWEAAPKGTADIWSAQNLTREEALQLLHSVLMKNGFAALTAGNKLTIISRDSANTRELPVKFGGDPEQIPSNTQLVTQILPVRYTEVSQIVKDLQPLLSTRTVITANESANSLVITDTQANIRRVAEIVKAIDAGAQDVTLVRVIRLRNSSPSEMVDLLSELFPDQNTSQNQTGTQIGGSPGGFGGPPGGFGPPGMGGGMPGPDGNSTPSSTSQRLKKGAKVTAVADERTGSIVVSAPQALLGQVERVVADLDADGARRQKLTVIKLQNAGAQSVADVLQDLFQKDTTTSSQRNRTTQTDALTTRASSQTQTSSSSSTRGSGMGGGTGGGNLAGGSGGLGNFGQ